MTAEQYERWTKPFVDKPVRIRYLIRCNRLLMGMCYIIFPLLVFLQWMQHSSRCLPTILTAGISFFCVSIFRKIYNKKRPYEALEIEPLIKKKKKGNSFPSRHVFSVFVIAMCWFCYIPVVGVILMVAGVFMAWVRVIGGVHYPIDVVAGALLGLISGVIGLILI